MKAIGKEAFQYCGLTNIVISDSVEVIEDNAFCGLKSTGTTLTFGKNIRSIGNKAFEDAHIIGDMVIPDKVETIGDLAFLYCGIETLKLGKSVKSLGVQAFRESRSLVKVTFNEGLESIGDDCFYGCDIRGTLTLKKGLKSIGATAFLNQSGITNIVFPYGLETIGSQAFQGIVILLKKWRSIVQTKRFEKQHK